MSLKKIFTQKFSKLHYPTKLRLLLDKNVTFLKNTEAKF